MEDTLKITKNHHKHLNNPFPSTPRSLPLVQGTLAFNPQTVPSDQIFSIGKEFLSTWRSKNGGSLSISHQSEPNRAIWSTIPGQAFVSAALALEFIERFTDTIGRPPELPEWIISGAVVGIQGGTDFVRDVWDKLQAYDVPISAFWLQEASRKGLPVCRHLFLHYPSDEYVHNLSYEQFLVGEEILVVPVLDKGKKNVKVYFPLGETCSWKHIWTGKLYTKQGSEAWVEAPVGYPAIFVKAGSFIGETFLKYLREYDVL